MITLAARLDPTATTMTVKRTKRFDGIRGKVMLLNPETRELFLVRRLDANRLRILERGSMQNQAYSRSRRRRRSAAKACGVKRHVLPAGTMLMVDQMQ